MTQRQSISAFLLLLFIAIGSVPLFSPPAPPIPDNVTQIVVLSEDDTTDFNKGFFRTALHGEEETLRTDSCMVFISLEAYHDYKFQLRIVTSDQQFNTRTQKSSLYLLNSCLTI